LQPTCPYLSAFVQRRTEPALVVMRLLDRSGSCSGASRQAGCHKS